METIESQVRSSQPLAKHPVELEKWFAQTQVGNSEVIASMERLEQELSGAIAMFKIWCASRDLLRDHLAVQASSIDSPEKQTDAREIPASECARTWGVAHGR